MYNIAKVFASSPDFKEGCIKSTNASFGGGWYDVELFNDGTWRLLWSASIGNKYSHPASLLVPLPIIDVEAGDDISDAFDCQIVELQSEFLANI